VQLIGVIDFLCLKGQWRFAIRRLLPSVGPSSPQRWARIQQVPPPLDGFIDVRQNCYSG